MGVVRRMLGDMKYLIELRAVRSLLEIEVFDRVVVVRSLLGEL